MKKTILILGIIINSVISVSAQSHNKALLLIDIQDFYFPGGKSALVEPEKAADNAARILAKFRNEKSLIIHVRHNAEPGGKINERVKPLPDEKIYSKDEVNCFLGNDLNAFLKANKVDTLVICGMQTHMCVEAATRAASDLGYKCILIDDACATKDLMYNNRVVKAADVHYSTLSTLKSYAKVLLTDEYIGMTQPR